MDSWRVFGRGDVRQVLLALWQTAAQTETSDEWLRGFGAALAGVAVAFGVEPPRVIERGERELPMPELR